MKYSIKRTAAFILALLLALSTCSFADEAIWEEASEVNAIPADQEVAIVDADSADPVDTDAVSVTEAYEEQEIMFGNPEENDQVEETEPEPEEVTDSDAQSVTFDQSVVIDDVTISVSGAGNCFPEGSVVAAERVTDDEIARTTEAVIGTQGEYRHEMFRIEVLDASNNVILPNEGSKPVVRVDGLSLAENAQAVVYDTYSKEAFALDTIIKDGSVEFAFVDSTVYDLVTLLPSEEQSVEEEIEEVEETEVSPEIVVNEETVVSETDVAFGEDELPATADEQFVDDAPETQDVEIAPETEALPDEDVDQPKESETPSENARIDEVTEETKESEAPAKEEEPSDESIENQVASTDEADSDPDQVKWDTTDVEDIVELPELYEGDSTSEAGETSSVNNEEKATYKPESHVLEVNRDTKLSINHGDTLIINSSKSITSWSSGKKSVASVVFDGEKATVTTYKPGKATLTAKLTNKKKITLTLTVNDPYLPTSVNFVNVPKIFTVGDTVKLSDYVALQPAYATGEYTWKTSNKRVAKVGKDGTLYALKAGKAKITVKTRNKKSRAITVTVVANAVKGFYGKPSKANATALGEAFSIWPKSVEYAGSNKIVAEFYILNGSKQKLQYIRGFSLEIYAGSINNKIASQYFSKVKVNCSKRSTSTFKVTFSGVGVLQRNVHLTDYASNKVYFGFDTKHIYATAGKKSVGFAETKIPNLPDPVYVSSIALSSGSLTLKKGESAKLSAKVSPDNADDKGISWSSSNYNVAAVDKYGNVTAVGVGTATITATATDGSGVSGSCTVTVPDDVVLATSLMLDQSEVIIYVGETATITSTMLPDNANDKKLSYSFTPASIAKTNKASTIGNIGTFIIEGVQEGTTTLTVKTKDGSNKSATCKITVKAKPTVTMQPTVTTGPTVTTKPTVTDSPQETVNFTVTHKDLSGTTLTLDPKASAVADNVDGGYSTLTINSNMAWTATLKSSSFVKFLSTGSTATISSTTSAKANAGDGVTLRIKLVKTPEPGKTSTETLTFKVGNKTYTYKIKQTKPAAKLSASFDLPKKVLTLGETWIVEGKVSAMNSYLGKVTVNAYGYSDSKLPNGAGRSDNEPSEDFTGQNRWEISLKDWAGFTVDTNKAPFNQAKTFTLQIWAKDVYGTGGDAVLATMELEVVEKGKYNASAAVKYALDWGGSKRNSNQYTTYAQDCANFVSQCLYAGGLETDEIWYKNSYAWKITSNSAENSKGLLQAIEAKGYKGQSKPSSVSNLKPGDIIWCAGEDSNGNSIYQGHVMIVTKISGNTFYYTAHTNDRLNEPSSSISWLQYWIPMS